jgi:hypothetical protein
MDNSWQPPIDRLPIVKEASGCATPSRRIGPRWPSEAARRSIETAICAWNFCGASMDRAGMDRDARRRRSLPPSLTQSVILTYVSAADGPPIDRWVGFRELPNGLFYAQAFQGYTGAVLVRDLNGDVAAFKRAGEKLQGATLAIGDAGYIFQMLPRIKLAVTMWSGDDEFPAQAQVLFQETAPHYLITDGLAIVGSLLVGQIAKAAKA